MLQNFVLASCSIMITACSSVAQETAVNQSKQELAPFAEGDLGPAEAFATFDPNSLEAYIARNKSKDFSIYIFGRQHGLIHAAITNPNSDFSIQSALSLGADINHQDADGRTPLHHSVGADSLQSTIKLIESGADANVVNDSNASILDICNSYSGSTASCKYILGK